MCSTGFLVCFVEFCGIPGIALPIESVLGEIFVKTFPPNGVVVKVKRNVCKDVVLLGVSKSVEV